MCNMGHVIPPPLLFVAHSTIHSQPMGQQAASTNGLRSSELLIRKQAIFRNTNKMSIRY